MFMFLFSRALFLSPCLLSSNAKRHLNQRPPWPIVRRKGRLNRDIGIGKSIAGKRG